MARRALGEPWSTPRRRCGVKREASSRHTVTTEVSGSIFHIDNKIMSKIARIAGAPRDKGAGVLIHRLRGDRVEKGDKMFTVFAESEAKLEFALKALKDLEPIEMRKMLLGTVE